MEEVNHFEKLTETEKISLILELKEKLQEAESQCSRLVELENIFRTWIRLGEKQFPSNCSGIDIGGMTLDILESDVFGCASMFLTRGKLEPRQKEALYFCNDCLDTAILELHGYEGWYYRQLKAVASAIIEFLNKWR